MLLLESMNALGYKRGYFVSQIADANPDNNPGVFELRSRASFPDIAAVGGNNVSHFGQATPISDEQESGPLLYDPRHRAALIAFAIDSR